MKQLSTIKKYLSYILLVIVVLSMLFLIASIVKSAYFYQYDNDEIYHVQRAYLIASGIKSYISFFFVFTDIFHKIIAPIILFFGLTFATLAKVRVFMIILFVSRIILTALLIDKVFNRKVALLFIPILLLDPFTIFSSMQIRPDNLMMTVYTLGLLIFTVSLIKSSKSLLFLSGAIFGLSFFILLKIVPQLMVLFFVYGIYCIMNRELKNFVLLLDGFLLTTIIFCLYHLFNGSLILMFKQVYIISFSLSDLITPTSRIYYGFFHQPNNGFIYGLMGKPLTWFYAWILPLFAFAGAYLALTNVVKSKEKIFIKEKNLIKIILIGSLIVQFIFLLSLNTAFIQYYIPFQWLLALFTAVIIEDLIFNKFTSGILSILTKTVIFVLFITLCFVSVKANNSRMEFRSDYQAFQYNYLWSKIPQGKAIFPSFLFRPIVHPVTEGFNNSEDYNGFYASIDKKLPSYIYSFGNAKLPYLIIDSPDRFYNLEIGLDKYVKDHYKIIDNKINLYQRVK